MQGRRAAKIEADRQYFVKKTIDHIYKSALQAADTQDTTSYKYLVSSARVRAPGKPVGPVDYHATMLFDNSNEIIEELRKLFPECTVKYMRQICDSRGAWHEESTMTEALKPFLTMNCQDVIQIDWA
jgi:hypothetical protein